MPSLFQEVRSEQNIFSAWRHVKRSALSSSNDEIKGAASKFEHAHQQHLHRIIRQLREGRFSFDPVKGVLKDARQRIAAGKDPRPIALATLKNRVVQRAILQVLQPREARNLKEQDPGYHTKIDKRLGRINDVNCSPYGVGGLIFPYGGVLPAINLIRKEIDGGARYYYRSDIKAFFTKIPTENVVNFVRSETQDEELSVLFKNALLVHLANEDELNGYAKLFPKGGIGVAQGSSLSAFAGNALLYNLDHELNGLGVTAVRYIDDILIVSKDETALDAAIDHAETSLGSLGFGLYAPASGSDKAARGECSKAINFLGCTLQPKRCVPSAASIDRLKESISKALSDSKSAIKESIRTGKPLSIKMSKTSTLDLLGKRIYGWQKSFDFCTDEVTFVGIDQYVQKQVFDYERVVARLLKGSDPTIQMMVSGIPSTRGMFLANRRAMVGSTSVTTSGAGSSVSIKPAR